ncbi:hypothetical protein BELL_0650g00060 [Botrytis elliptica]|uniref:Uncharacterized protein n=1 Tax=Botrytis elliptica TaxID=278938 RepID=A0A4Z1JH72_9HELO|nr:hypothetical protein EAE99_004794 [Botrytis elliptica]TGO70890.1 hypothetical protein BELL_0650g00060 [Botrytis elliptica]
MHSHFSTAVLAVLFRNTLCDTFYYEGISSVVTSTFTPITYYSPTTLISSAHPASTEIAATDHSTTPTYYTYPSYSTSKSTSTEQTTYILPTSGLPTTTEPTTYVYPTTTTSSSSSTCVSPTFTWTEPTTVPTDIPSYGSYRMGKRADPPKLTPDQIEKLRKLIRIYDAIEKAKPVIDKAIEDGLTECQDFKDLVAILKLFAPIFDGLQEWLDERHL